MSCAFALASVAITWAMKYEEGQKYSKKCHGPFSRRSQSANTIAQTGVEASCTAGTGKTPYRMESPQCIFCLESEKGQALGGEPDDSPGAKVEIHPEAPGRERK